MSLGKKFSFTVLTLGAIIVLLCYLVISKSIEDMNKTTSDNIVHVFNTSQDENKALLGFEWVDIIDRI